MIRGLGANSRLAVRELIPAGLASILSLTVDQALSTSTAGMVDDLNALLSEDICAARSGFPDSQASKSARSLADSSPAKYLAARVQSSSSVIVVGLFAYMTP
jgi:hypothetical protein